MAVAVPAGADPSRDSLRYLQRDGRGAPEGDALVPRHPRRRPAPPGQGIGAALVDHTLERLDREGLPAYLETDKESNLAWYARRRFELARDPAPRCAPVRPIWTMWRDPT